MSDADEENAIATRRFFKGKRDQAYLAYMEALRLIAEAKKLGSRSLSFDAPTTHALEILPPEIAALDELRTLILDNTQVADLAPIAGLVRMTVIRLSNTKVSKLAHIAGMGEIRRLFLSNTQVADLTPIATMEWINTLILDNTQVADLTPFVGMVERMAQRLGMVWLRFENCAAARADPQIAQIAAMKDDDARATALFLYLRDMVPPGEASNAPALDDLLPVQLLDGRLEIARSLPSEVEIDDRLKRAIHERLRLKANELARMAGNTQGRLAGRARSLADRLDRPFEELDMINIHIDVEDLSTSLRTNADRVGDERYSSDIVDALTDVASIGPGLTLDNVDVEKLEDRKRRFVANPPGAEVMAAHNALSLAVASDMVAMGDNLRALEARIVDREGEASSGAIQVSVHRDILIKARRYSLTRTEAVLLGAAGSGLWQFVFENRDVIMLVANSYGAGFAHWFSGMIAQVSDFAGLAAHVEVKPILRKREP